MNNSKNSPTISVILTSYNHDKYLHDAIKSVLNQSFQDFELIIWDDSSVDDSWSIIQSYNDPRIKTYRNSQHKGPVFGVNKVIFEIAVGKYIAIHHSDDVWVNDKLAKQVDFLDANEQVGAVFSNVQAVDQRGMPLTDETHHYYNIFSQPNRSRHQWLRHFFLKGNALCHPSILIRKQCYIDCGAYRDMLAQLPDLDMWMRLCAKYEIYVMQDRLVKFRVLDGEMNTSGDRPTTRIRHENEYFKLLQQYRTLLGANDIFKVFPDFISYNRDKDTDSDYVLARVCLESGDSILRQLLAIEILFDILNDSERKKAIEEVYSFSSNDFLAITEKFNLFSYQNLLIERDEQISHLNETVAEQKINILALEKNLSLSRRITLKVRRTFNITSPLRIIAQRTVKLIWWTITLQLPTKLHEWRLSNNTVNTEKPILKLPCNDYCFSVPSNFPLEKSSITPSIAVVCHLYYPEMLEEFKRYLSNIPFSFDLFITTDLEEKKNAIANGLQDWRKGAIEIRLAPNQGRDIAPKLIAFHEVYERYEFFLHIHSKKSLHAEHVTAGWRFYLLETLLGSEQIVQSIFAAFTSDSQLGMIAPEHFPAIRPNINWGQNFPAAQAFSSRLGINLSPNGKFDFPSGSMFWGRSAAIKPLLSANLTIHDFPPENNQIDGTLAHVIERLYFFVCEQAGYRWIKIAQPNQLNVQKMLMAVSKESLSDAIEYTQYHLLVSHEK